MATKKQTGEANAKNLVSLNESLNKSLKDELELKKGIMSEDERQANISEQIANNQRTLNELLLIQKTTGADITKDYEKILAEQKELIRNEKEINKQLKAGVDHRKKQLETLKFIGQQLKIGWEYLMKSDKVIRNTILNLGLSGAKAEAMRASFEGSAGLVSRLGGNLEDVQKIMEGFADETGRAQVLSAEMVKDIFLIGKGTGLGIEQAAKLGAQFQIMGVDAKTTMDYVQGVVDTSERMGVNTTKVLKNINDNFKKLNTYTFQQGSKGFAQMAMYAEKMKINMNDALNAATVAKGLEGAIDLAAQLQVMGGEFAKTDPFEMLFLSRNDPAKFTEKIADMTKGVVSFRKMADGTFEKFISPADRDRLAQVAKSLGMEESALTEIALRTADIGKMRKEMSGMGLSAKDKELIESQGKFNSKLGKFQVTMGSVTKDITELTAKDLKLLETQKVSLEKRAEDAQTFEDAFKGTVAELKAALLPILKAINSTLTYIRPFVKSVTEIITGGPLGWLKAAGALMGAALIWRGITNKMGDVADRWVESGSRKGKVVSAFSKRKGGTANAGGAGGGMLGKMSGGGMMKAGAGIGAAAVGIGAGIGAAAAGISLLADSMSKLTPEQAETLSSIVQTLGWFIVGGALAAGAIMVLGTASTAASLGLLALGGSALMIGAGIGIAAAGIGYMVSQLTGLVSVGKDAGTSMLSLGAGMAMLGASMGLFTVGALGLAVFAGTMKVISKNAESMVKVGDAFKNISAVMSGTKEDWIAIQNAVTSISKLNVKGGGMLADLSNLMKTPLRVKFDNNGEIKLKIDIDGKTVLKTLNLAHDTAQANNESKGRGVKA